MIAISREDILAALRRVKHPNGEDVVTLGMISGVTVQQGKIGFLVTAEAATAGHYEGLRVACEQAVKAMPGVVSVTAVLTAENNGPAAPSARPAAGPLKPAQWNREPLEDVKRIVLVASGKGGVGKSTTAVNLAYAAMAMGKRVGLLDADIYGPSLPRMLGIHDKPETERGKILPLEARGIRAMSMGLLVAGESALVWRGPQATKALAQMLRGVAWGHGGKPLDLLLVDLPPGTGDVHLSLVQQVPVDGAVVVTTPQEVAVADARKCIDMLRKVNVPILGVVENMSGFRDPATGALHPIFGEGGGKRLAEEAGVPLLGQVPIVMAIGQAADDGRSYEDETGIYRKIAAVL